MTAPEEGKWAKWEVIGSSRIGCVIAICIIVVSSGRGHSEESYRLYGKYFVIRCFFLFLKYLLCKCSRAKGKVKSIKKERKRKSRGKRRSEKQEVRVENWDKRIRLLLLFFLSSGFFFLSWMPHR